MTKELFERYSINRVVKSIEKPNYYTIYIRDNVDKSSTWVSIYVYGDSIAIRRSHEYSDPIVIEYLVNLYPYHSIGFESIIW